MGMKLVQTNFSSGEIGPLMDMRHDSGAYANGARRLRNVSLFNQGGISRRPGTEYLATLNGKSRLIPFEFSNTEQYIFAFQNTRLDIYSTAGVLIQSITGCPWTSTILFSMTYSQAADVMILCSPQMATQIITRTSATTFTRTAFAFTESVNADLIYQPYYKFANDTITLSASGTTGSVTLTTSAAFFTAGYVGTRVRWFGIEIAITAYTNSTTVTGTIKGTLKGTYDIDPLKTTDGNAVVEVTHANHGFTTGTSITLEGINAFAGLTKAHLNGTFTITVINDNVYSYTTGGTANTSADGGGPNAHFSGNNLPTRNWDEPAFSTVRGYPGCVTFHEGRLWFGGSYSQPDSLWSSKIGQFFNFDVGEGLDNESIQVSVGSDDISSVLHLVSNRHLQIFSATSEFYVPRVSQSTITPGNITIARQTPYGSSSVTPLPFDGATVYLQATRGAIREFLYTDTEQAYSAPVLSLLADHLIDSPVDMNILFGTEDRPEQYLLVVNNDGTIAVFHSARSEKLAAWSLWDTQHPSGTAKFDSSMSIGNRVYFSVLRGSSYYLERMAKNDLDLTLDCAKSYTNGSATKTWTIDAIYSGRTISVVSNNYYLGDFACNGSNQIILNDEVTSITVGFNYNVTIETLPANVLLPGGNYSGRPKRIARVILALNSTLAVSIQGNKLIVKQVRDDFSLSPTAVTGKREFFLLGFNRDATVIINQSEPLPLRLLGMAMEVSI
jgi:hypothetical protein